jgi:hypothetical protein
MPDSLNACSKANCHLDVPMMAGVAAGASKLRTASFRLRSALRKKIQLDALQMPYTLRQEGRYPNISVLDQHRIPVTELLVGSPDCGVASLLLTVLPTAERGHRSSR